MDNIDSFVWMSFDMLDIISFGHIFCKIGFIVFVSIYYNLGSKGYKFNLQKNVPCDETKCGGFGAVRLEHTAHTRGLLCLC